MIRWRPHRLTFPLLFVDWAITLLCSDSVDVVVVRCDTFDVPIADSDYVGGRCAIYRYFVVVTTDLNSG